jgi:endonuclease III
MLLFAGGCCVLPVDVGVYRVAQRLGYEPEAAWGRAAARRVGRAIAREIAPRIDAYRDAYLYLSHHAGATCTEGDPHCRVCPLLGECPGGQRVMVRSGEFRRVKGDRE